jgi:anti-anti-sigma factor
MTHTTLKTSVRAHIQNGVNYITVNGDIEMFDINRIKQQLHNLSHDTSYNLIQLDLYNVHYMDSMGLATIIDFIKSMKNIGKNVEIVRTQENITSLFKLAGMYDFIFGKNNNVKNV